MPLDAWLGQNRGSGPCRTVDSIRIEGIVLPEILVEVEELVDRAVIWNGRVEVEGGASLIFNFVNDELEDERIKRKPSSGGFRGQQFRGIILNISKDPDRSESKYEFYVLVFEEGPWGTAERVGLGISMPYRSHYVPEEELETWLTRNFCRRAVVLS